MSRDERMAAFTKLLDSVAEDFLASKGLGYRTWEKELPVNLGSPARWMVISHDGQRFPLAGEHQAIVRQMNDWVMLGRGKNPSEAWFQERESVMALPGPQGRSTMQRR